MYQAPLGFLVAAWVGTPEPTQAVVVRTLLTKDFVLGVRWSLLLFVIFGIVALRSFGKQRCLLCNNEELLCNNEERAQIVKARNGPKRKRLLNTNLRVRFGAGCPHITHYQVPYLLLGVYVISWKSYFDCVRLLAYPHERPWIPWTQKVHFYSVNACVPG